MNKVLFITESLTPEFSRHELIFKLSKKLEIYNYEFKYIEFSPITPSSTGNLNKIKKYSFCEYKSRLFSNLQIIKAIIFLRKTDIILIGGYGHIECWIAFMIGLFKKNKLVGWLGASNKTTINKNFIYRYLKKSTSEQFVPVKIFFLSHPRSL